MTTTVPYIATRYGLPCRRTPNRCRPTLTTLLDRLKASPRYGRLVDMRARMAAKGLREVVIARWSLS